eukprot:1521_1
MATVNEPELQNTPISDMIGINSPLDVVSAVNTKNTDKSVEETECVEQKELEEKELKGEDTLLDADITSDEMIQNTMISRRMNPPKTPESEGDDTKGASESDEMDDVDIGVSAHMYSDYLFECNQLNQIWIELDEIQPKFTEYTQKSTRFAEKLIQNVERECEEVMRHIKHRKDILLREIESIEAQNQENIKKIKHEFDSMMQFKMDTLNKKDDALNLKAIKYYNQHKDKLNLKYISDALYSSKLNRLKLFCDTNHLKNAIHEQFKLIQEVEKEQAQEEPQYEYAEYEQSRRYKAQDRRYDSYSNTNNYYNYKNERNQSYYSNEYYAQSHYDDENDGGRRRRRGSRRRGRRGRRRGRRSYSDDYSWTNNNEYKSGYVFNDYVPNATPNRHRDRGHDEDGNDNNGSIGDDDQTNAMIIYENDNNAGVEDGGYSQLSTRRKKQWTKKEKEKEKEKEFGGNTHHIFVRDTENLDFSSIKQKYRDIVLICQFSEHYHSKNGLVLSKNRTVLQRVENQKHGYAVLDCKPVFDGQHCWRIKCQNFSPWIFIGVCRPSVEYTDTSWNNKYVWGISTCSQSNRNGHWTLDYSVKAPHWKNQQILQIDMLLDCRNGVLKYAQIKNNNAIIQDQSKDIIVLHGLNQAIKNKNHNNSWIPHFNLHTRGSKITVKKIPYAR